MLHSQKSLHFPIHLSLISFFIKKIQTLLKQETKSTERGIILFLVNNLNSLITSSIMMILQFPRFSLPLPFPWLFLTICTIWMGIVFSNSDAPIEEKSADHCAKAYSIHRRRFCRREMLRSAKESLFGFALSQPESVPYEIGWKRKRRECTEKCE